MDAFVALLSACIMACIPILVPAALKLLRLNIDASHRDALDLALADGVGAALKTGQDAGDARLQNVTINAGLQAAVAYVNAAATDAHRR